MANRSHKSNQKLTQAEYRRHIFDKARGRSGAASARAGLLYGDQPWYKPDRSLGELYEQENSVKNWGNLDRTDRMAYREAELKEVRRLIGESVRKHPGVKGKDKDVVSNIIDAYVNGKDLPKDLSETERKDWGAILDDSTANAIEGTALPTRWKSAAQTGTMPESNGASSETGPVVQNGKAKSPASDATGKPAQLAPRPVPDPETSTAQRNRGTTNPDTRVNGLSDRNQTEIVNKLNGAARADAGVLRANAETARKDADSAARIADVSRSIRERQAKEGLQDQAMSDIERQHDARMAKIMDDRYKNRSFRDAKDWENLGRLREGDTALSQDEYNKRVEGLLGRAKGLRSAEGRAGMTSNEVRDMMAMFKTVGNVTKGEDGNYTGNLTPAQLDALGKRMKDFETIRDNRRSMTKAQMESFARRAADSVRKQYGLEGFSDEDVLAFRDRRRAKESSAALNELLGMKDPQTVDELVKFDEAWKKLQATTNIADAFNRAMEGQDKKERYMDTLAGLPKAQRDMYYRRTIIDQLGKEARESTGLKDDRKVLDSALAELAPVQDKPLTPVQDKPRSGVSDSRAPVVGRLYEGLGVDPMVRGGADQTAVDGLRAALRARRKTPTVPKTAESPSVNPDVESPSVNPDVESRSVRPAVKDFPGRPIERLGVNPMVTNGATPNAVTALTEVLAARRPSQQQGAIAKPLASLSRPDPFAAAGIRVKPRSATVGLSDLDALADEALQASGGLTSRGADAQAMAGVTAMDNASYEARMKRRKSGASVFGEMPVPSLGR